MIVSVVLPTTAACPRGYAGRRWTRQLHFTDANGDHPPRPRQLQDDAQPRLASWTRPVPHEPAWGARHDAQPSRSPRTWSRETYLKAHQKFHQYNIKAWALSILTNTYTTGYRSAALPPRGLHRHGRRLAKAEAASPRGKPGLKSAEAPFPEALPSLAAARRSIRAVRGTPDNGPHGRR